MHAKQSKQAITVMDVLNFVGSKGAPVSGLAITALVGNLTPDTVIEANFFSPEVYKEIITWKKEEYPANK